jgi:hypothetical protein
MPLRPEDRVDHPELQSVPREEHVPNDARALPSDRPTVLIGSVIVGAIVIVGTVLAYFGYEMIAMILALVCLVLGIIGIIMARGDARVSMTSPILATIMAALLTIVVGFDLLGADEVLEGQGDQGEPVQDPAAIVEPRREPVTPADDTGP